MDPDISGEIAQLQQVYELILGFLVNYSFQLLGAVVVFFIGHNIAKRVSALVLSLCQRKQLDVTLSDFIANVVRISILTMVVVICLNIVGISITPLIAAIGALSLGAGLAIQGLLSNYGAGFNIILTRPFVVGDTISVQGVSGQVTSIQLAFTLLEDEDGVQTLIPNKHIVGEILQNSKEVTLVELSVGIAYSSDVDAVLKRLQQVLEAHPMVSQTPKAQVGIGEFADSSIAIDLRFWAQTKQLVASRFSVNKLIWDTLQEMQVDIPFPQRDITIKQDHGQ